MKACGPGDGIRTRIELNPRDFKSLASHQLRHTQKCGQGIGGSLAPEREKRVSLMRLDQNTRIELAPPAWEAGMLTIHTNSG